MEYNRGRTFNSERSQAETPFSQELRNFIAKSRKCQTLYANMEGTYKRRTMRKEEKHSLEEYIYNAVYYTEGCSWTSETNASATETVNSIANKIVNVSSRYHRDEIHFCVIWVYYYNYGKRSTECTPVFKIFTTKTGSTGVFINVSLNYFESWDCYLDTAEFPKSFLCTPRHGEYNFVSDEDILNLEFMCPVRSNSNATHRSMKMFVPYCIAAVKPMLQNVKNCERWVVSKIMDFSSWLVNFIKEHKVVAACFAVGVVGIAAAYFYPRMLTWMPSPEGLAKMLLNNGVSVLPDIKTLVSGQPLSDPNTLPTEAGHSAVLEKGKELIRLLKNPVEKTWREIVRAFCFLYRECRPYLVSIIEAAGLGKLKYLLQVLDVVDTVVKGWDNPVVEVDIQNGIATSNRPSLVDSTDGMTIGSGQRGPFGGSTPPQWNSSNQVIPTDLQVARISAENAEPMSLHRMLNDFHYLEEHSWEGFRTAPEPPTNQEIPCGPNGLLIQRQDKVVIIVRAVRADSFPRLSEWLVRLLGTGVTLRLVETNVIDVLGPGGTVLGTLHYPTDSSVVGVFSEEALIVPRNNQGVSLEGQTRAL